MRFTRKNNAVANRKMKHGFKYLNGSYGGFKPHPPQNQFEGPDRRRLAHKKANELRRSGYTWQASRIYNYEHRLTREKKL